MGPAGLRGGGRRRLCGPPQLWHRHHQPPAGSRGLQGGRAGPAPLHRLRGLQAVRKAEVRLLHRRRQCGQHGESLFRRKDPRAEDEYSPGGKGGARPDRSATVYTRLAKQAYPDLPVILGGLEASLRRFAHYDYWLDTVLPSIAEDSGADIISFGMGEHQTVEIAAVWRQGSRWRASPMWTAPAT